MDSAAARAAYATARNSRKASRLSRDAAAAAREAALARALDRPRARAVAAPPSLMNTLRKKASRLLDDRFAAALRRLAAVAPVRPIEEWAPRGKGASSLFRSLAAHLCARYPMPAILWSAFTDDAGDTLAPIAAQVASGASFYDVARVHLPMKLTRAMCHDILSTPVDVGFLRAVRRAQARACGLDGRLLAAWSETRFARALGSASDEEFWATFVEWLGRAGGMLDAAEVGPLTDYVAARRAESPGFSMRGRSGAALLQAMRAWHVDLAVQRTVSAHVFTPSGFLPAEYREVRREHGADVREVWRVREILSARALADEGKAMGHCVYSYAPRVARGEVSIWSVTMEDGRGETGNWRMVTVEVHNASKRVVQARGRHNRLMTAGERRILERWAALSALGLNV